MSRDGPKGAGGESCCVRQPCRKETPAGGMTRRLRRERWGCRPEGGVLSFEAKESTKESQRHGNSCGPPRYASRASVCGSPFGAVLDLGSLRSPFREKALYCPLLKEGVRNVARNIVGEITLTFVRARAHSFPLSKRARLFPSAAYRRSAPPQLALGRLKWRRLGCFGEAWMASQRKRPKGFPNHVSLWREPEGLSPDGGLRSTTNRKLNKTREPRGLSPSGGKTPANFHVSLRPCAPMARSPGCRGTAPA